MKIKICEDEWYPMYYECALHGYECEISDEDMAFVKEAFERFDKAQLILSKLYGNNKQKINS